MASTSKTGTAAAATPAPAAAAAPAVAASFAGDPKDVLFPSQDTLTTDKNKTPGEPAQKKTRIQLVCEQDPSLRHVLVSVVGTREQKFTNGLLYPETIEAIKALWMKMDFVKEGILKQINFQSVRGIDPLWEELLESCDVDGDGSIRPSEFVAGFVFVALDKPMTNLMPQGATVTGLTVLKGVAAMINEHVMTELSLLKQKMGWQ